MLSGKVRGEKVPIVVQVLIDKAYTAVNKVVFPVELPQVAHILFV